MKNILKICLITILTSQIVLAQNIEDLKNIKDKEPFKVSGQVRLNGSLSNISGIDNRVVPYYYGVHTKLNFSIYGFDIPVYFGLRDNSFHFGQNLPRLKINPKYKWMELQLGDTFLKFNEYTLSQRNIRGVAAIAKPGLFRFQAIYGKLKDLNSYRDTLQLGIAEIENFTQKMIGASLGFGSSKNNVDIYAISAFDDQDSLFYVEQNLRPRSNVVVGSSVKLAFKNGIGFQGNIGLTGFTNDVNGLGQEETARLSENTDLYTLNTTTQVSAAWDASAYLRFSSFGLNAKIRHIGQSYQAFTVAYLRTNLRSYTIGGYFRAFKSRLFLNGTLGIEHNDVSEVNANRTDRLVYNINGNIRFSKAFSASLNYSNFSQNFETRLININELYTYTVNNITRSLSLNYRAQNDLNEFNISVSGGQNAFETLVPEDQLAGDEFSGLFISLNTSFALKKSDWKFNANVDRRDYNGINNSNQNYGFGIGVNKSILDGHLSFGARGKFSLINRDAFREGSNMSANVFTSYRHTKERNYSLSLYRIQRSSNVSADFTELRLQASLIQKF